MDTHLPDFVLARLFKDSLVLPSQSIKPALEPEPKGSEINLSNSTNSAHDKPEVKKWWLGDNTHKITILLLDKSHVFTGEKELEFLTNILSACHLNLSNVALINYDKTPLGYKEIQINPGCEKLILFGVTPQQIQLQFNFPAYQPQEYEQITFLQAAALPKMMQNSPEAKEEKKKLWFSLKKLFNI